MKTKQELIKNSTIFAGLTDPEISVLAEKSEIVTCKKDAVVFKTGERSRSLYIVKSGEVRIVTFDESDREQVLARFIRGEIFGEFDLFENDPRTATAMAGEDSQLLVFPRPGLRFGALYKKDPALFVKIYRNLISVNARRIRQTNDMVSEKSSWINDLKEQMLKDKLTGFYNRTYLDDEFPRVLQQLTACCIAVVKPDDFKVVNDTFGHEAGDSALRVIAGTALEGCGDMDIIVRFRGNEFMVIYCNHTTDSALPLVKSLHRKLGALDIGRHIGESSLKLTYSIGMAEYPLHTEVFETLVQLAYARMFEQRESGGNGIRVTEGVEVDLVPFLQSVRIFSSLYISQLKSVAACLRPLSVLKGEVICRQGEPGNELFIIETGSATAGIHINGEEEKVISAFGPGEFFGEMAIFENAERSATCRAAEDATLFMLTKDDFFSLAEREPVIAIKIMQQMLDITSARLNRTGSFIAEMVRWGNDAGRRAVTDELTGVYNRRFLDSSLEKHVRTARQDNKPLTLIMADLDYFREVNEGYSHETGDRYIIEVARVFQECLSEGDVIARYGGDEFTILLPGTGLERAVELAEDIRKKVEGLGFLKGKKGPALSLSVSLGLAVFPLHCKTKEQLSACADQALYRAKESGRNRVAVWTG